MKAYEIQKFGFENLKLVERPQPEPATGEVLIRVRALSLNFRDLLILKGHYNARMPLPRVPLSDGAGEVVAVGQGVTRVSVGDRVMGNFSQSWLDGEPTLEKSRGALGGDVDGMATEFVALSQEGVVRVPAHLSDEEAATLPCAAVTAWNALVRQGNIKAGDTVLLLGTGGVSLFALQFARLFGARTIITSSSDEKLARARELGAHDTINYRSVPEWERRVLDLTGGRGVDHIVEVGGAGTLPKSLRAVRVGGCIALIGVLTGVGDVNPLPIIMRSIQVRGVFVGSRTMFEEMNRAIELHRLKPVVDRVFDFDELPAALRYMESGAHFGKIVVRV
ncbi:MAG: NAD(P)-dependent alcohol dehydrogenase [Planctomycetaceae bacterium]